MRLAIPLAIVALAAALLAGCGDSGDGGGSETTAPKPNGSSAPAGASAHECEGESALRATGLSCGEGQRLMKSWKAAVKCAPGKGVSRSSCRIEGGYLCLSVNTAKGVSVSCARPGRSIAFTVERG